MSEHYPRPDALSDQSEGSPSRNPFGWIVLVLLFAYLIVGTTERTTKESPASRMARYTSELQAAVNAKKAASNPVGRLLTSEGSPDQALRKLERESAPRHRQDPIEAVVWVTVRRQLGEKVENDDLVALRRSPENSIFAEAYDGKAKSPEAAKALVARLEARGPVSRIAADYVRRQAGLSAAPERLFSGRVLAGAGLIGSLILASGVAWLLAIVLGLSGTLKALGPATVARTPGDADRLALKAAILFTTFTAASLIAGLGVRLLDLDSRIASILSYGTMIVAVPIVMGGKAGMAKVGLSLDHFGRNVLLGLWAFLLELPVTMIVGLVGASLLKNLPQPTHPASTALLNSPDLLTIVATFFGGVIAAPFWEETMFRGTLFPALRRIAGGPVPAALLSSLLFASIHPQGPALWAALASVALFSCLLAQKTRSLVPSIVMHFAHNATLLVLTLLIGRG